MEGPGVGGRIPPGPAGVWYSSFARRCHSPGRAGGAGWADRLPESNLDTTKINNKLPHSLIDAKGRRQRCLMVPHYRPQVSPKKDNRKMELIETSVIRSNGHVCQGTLDPQYFQLPAIVKQTEGGWLQKLSYCDKMHVVGGFRHSCCRKR